VVVVVVYLICCFGRWVVEFNLNNLISNLLIFVVVAVDIV
jgi:hypothetical protein